MADAKHTYPPGYEPPNGELLSAYGSVAWEILDTLKPGMLPDPVRWLLSGYIAGAIEKAVSDALDGKPLPKPGKSRPRFGRF